MKTLILATTLTLAACGSSDGGGDKTAPAATPAGTTTPYSMAITAMADLPACDEAHNRQLVYVIETKEFQTCQAGAWAKIDISVTPAVDLVAEAKAIHNALKSIELGSAWDSAPANAKAALLSDKGILADDGTKCGVPAKSYTLIGYGAGDYKFNYALYVAGGKVTSICTWSGDTPTCTSVPCP